MAISANEQKILDRASRILAREMKGSAEVMNSPRVVQKFLHCRFDQLDHEVFAVLFLDTKNQLIEFVEMFHGTIDSASVYPREVVKAALSYGAASVIFAHNHPSGDAEPSDADRRITSRLEDALGLIDIRVLDHLVVGNPNVVSFAERGWI